MTIIERSEWATVGEPEERFTVVCNGCGRICNRWEGFRNLAVMAARQVGWRRAHKSSSMFDWCGECESGQAIYEALTEGQVVS